jgi:predicted transcriptional regulator
MQERIEISQKLLGSDVKLEILALFHENPKLVDEIDGVSRRIGRDAGEIEAEVKDLIDIGVLHSENVESSKVIYYDQKNDVELQKQISYCLREGTPSESAGMTEQNSRKRST